MRALKHILMLVLIGSASVATPAQAQTECDEMLLDEANRLYDLGRVDDTIDLLRPCLPRRLRRGPTIFRRRVEATQALRLMALSSYARRDPPDSTRQWVRGIVKLDRSYRADPEEDPMFFQVLVDELRPPRWYQRRWVQIGLVAGVSAAVYCIIQCGKADPLPGPPLDPPRVILPY